MSAGEQLANVYLPRRNPGLVCLIMRRVIEDPAGQVRAMELLADVLADPRCEWGEKTVWNAITELPGLGALQIKGRAPMRGQLDKRRAAVTPLGQIWFDVVEAELEACLE